MHWIFRLWMMGALLGAASAAVELESDFAGTSPATQLPWTYTSVQSPAYHFSGWTMGSGLSATSTNDALGFFVRAGVSPSTLSEALTAESWFSCSISPTEAALDLNGAQLNLQFRRHSWHAPRQFAVFTSVGGFAATNAVYRSELFENGDLDVALDLSVFLPQSGYGAVSNALEIRVVPYVASYHGHNTSFEAFSLVSGIQMFSLGVEMGAGGSAERVPNSTTFEEGTMAAIQATPDAGYRFAGWSGDIQGKGNPRSFTMDSDKQVTAHFEPLPELRMDVGQNLGGVADWSTSYVFKDLFLRMRDWLTRDAVAQAGWSSDLSSLIPLDENGWPTQVPFDPGNGSPSQLVHSILVRGNEAGPHTLFYEGEGSFELRVDGGYRGYPVCDGSARSISVDLFAYGQVSVLIKASGPAPNHLRNFHLVPDTYVTNFKTEPFHPLFVDRSAGFKVLRFMDWGHTNGSEVEEWSDRTTTNQHTQARKKGVALELMVQLCNQQKCDAWICIPHLADDAYVTKTAELIRDRLHTNQHVYVEYSNEVWNGMFAQYDYANTQGVALGLSSNAWEAGRMYTAVRSAEIWQLFENVFAAESSNRVVKVLATQSAGSSVTQAMVAALNDPTINTNAIFADALGIAPYFGHNYTTSELPPNVAAYPTPEEVAGALSIQEIETVKHHVAAQKAIAAVQGMRLICYEGGQHFTGLGAANTDATLTGILTQANRLPAMYRRYQEYLDMLQAGGVELFANFTLTGAWGRYGSWGTLERVDQPLEEAVKYMAIRDWMAERLDGERLLRINSFEPNHDPQSISWRSKPDYHYQLEGSTNLIHWFEIANGISSTGLSTTNPLPVSTNVPSLFYRVNEE